MCWFLQESQGRARKPLVELLGTPGLTPALLSAGLAMCLPSISRQDPTPSAGKWRMTSLLNPPRRAARRANAPKRGGEPSACQAVPCMPTELQLVDAHEVVQKPHCSMHLGFWKPLEASGSRASLGELEPKRQIVTLEGRW